MKKSPVCFVAMAFGRDDTDLFYEQQILPVLKHNGVKPVIINRHQSNDDLNFQIFDQLEKADFCIADLTYTRPSVYFEAGYAQRSIPVIYTVRKDHLGKGQPDDLRVHFDMQMKPIIDWVNVDDRTFAKRLEDRIKATFLREWIKGQKHNLKYENDEKKFREMPGFERHNYVRYHTILALRKLGYKESSWNVHKPFDRHNYTKSDIKNGFVNYVVGYKANKGKLYIASVQSFLSPTKNELIRLKGAHTSIFSLPESVRILIRKGKYKDIYINAITLSLNSLSASRIESVLPDIVPIENSKRYYETISSDSFTIFAEFYFLSGIKSLIRLKEQLEDVVSNL